jgi:hypothetical protein
MRSQTRFSSRLLQAASVRALWVLLAALVMLKQPLWAWDAALPVTVNTSPSAPAVRQLIGAADGGYWLIAEHGSVVHSLDRYRADGSLAGRSFETEVREWSSGYSEIGSLYEQADGTVAAMSGLDVLLSFDAGAQPLWQSQFSRDLIYCRNAAKTPSGAWWLSCEDDSPDVGLHRHDRMGRDLGRFGPPAGDFSARSRAIAVPGSESVWIGGQAQGRPAVLEIDASGSEVWRWQAADDWPPGAVWLLERRPAGGVLAVSGGRLIALDAMGTLMWTMIDESLPSGNTHAMYVSPVGVGALLTQFNDERQRLTLVDAAGVRSGSLDLPEGLNCGERLQLCGVHFGDNGRVHLVAISWLAPAERLRLLTLSPTAQLLDDQLLPDILNPQEVIAAAQGFLVRTEDRAWRVLDSGQVQHLSVAAAASAQPPSLLGEYQDGDNRIVGLGTPDEVIVAKLNSDGEVLWQRRMPSEPRVEWPWSDQAVQIGGPQLCFYDERVPADYALLRCLDRATGEVQFEHGFPDGVPESWGILANGILAYVDRGNDGQLIARRRRLLDGTELQPLVLPPFSVPANTRFPQEPRLRVDPFSGLSMALVGAATGLPGTTVAVFGADDPSARVLNLQSSPYEFWPQGERLFAIQQVAGSQSWLSSLRIQVVNIADATEILDGVLASEVFPPKLGVRKSAGQDHLHLSIEGVESQAAGGVASGTRLIALPRDGSRITWSQDIPTVSGSVVDLASVTSRNAALVVGKNGGALQLSLYDSADGALLETRAYPCGGGQNCFARAHSLKSVQERYRILSNSLASQGGRTLIAHSVDLASNRDVSISQSGITGVWYNPITSGQGFLLDFLPDSRTLFAPWFTFADQLPYQDQSALRWYSLFGVPELGAKRVSLDILRNAGGSFAGGPETTSIVVGRAQLSFHDCDHATLSYQFYPPIESGRIGSMPWQRIGARARPCELADGSIQPPQLIAPDSQGFGLRQSGTWFDPISSGQGMKIEVLPASSQQSGLLFAAWFTYDPQTPGDDAAAQDWLIMQGDLAAAQQGVVQVPVFRVVGGELDRVATSNLIQIGIAEFQFEGCDRLRVQYQFDVSAEAADHVGLNGVLNLERIGGCGVSASN